MPNTPVQYIRNITDQLSIPATHDLGTYLGVPLMHGRTRSSHFNPLVDKVRSRLGGWKSQLLSRVVRLILIQSVTSAASVYMMHSCKLPGRTIETLEKCNRDFFCGDDLHGRTIHPVSWDTICQPKRDGGLGLKPMRNVNQVLLAKLGWHCLNNLGKLWSRVLTCKYGHRANDINLARPTSSYIWLGLQWGYDLLCKGLQVTSHRHTEHRFYWTPSANGRFTTSSSHSVLQASSTSTVEAAQWNAIWKHKGQTRGALYLWMIRHDRLKTKQLLWHRHIIAEATCDICGVANESTLHALRDCILPRQV